MEFHFKWRCILNDLSLDILDDWDHNKKTAALNFFLCGTCCWLILVWQGFSGSGSLASMHIYVSTWLINLFMSHWFLSAKRRQPLDQSTHRLIESLSLLPLSGLPPVSTTDWQHHHHSLTTTKHIALYCWLQFMPIDLHTHGLPLKEASRMSQTHCIIIILEWMMDS